MAAQREAQREIFESVMMHRPCMEVHADIVIHDIMKHTPTGSHTPKLTVAEIPPAQQRDCEF